MRELKPSLTAAITINTTIFGFRCALHPNSQVTQYTADNTVCVKTDFTEVISYNGTIQGNYAPFLGIVLRHIPTRNTSDLYIEAAHRQHIPVNIIEGAAPR